MIIDLRGIRFIDHESQIITDEISEINLDAGDDGDIAVISCEVAGIRFWPDGEDPTEDEGHLLEKEQWLILGGRSNIKNFKAIREGETNATLRISYGI